MNLLEIIVLLLILLLVAGGFRKGFVRKMASMLSLAGSILLVSLVLPYVTQFLKEQTPVYSYIVEQCQTVVTAGIEQGAAALNIPDVHNLPEELQTQAIQSLPLPEFLQDQLVRYNNNESYLRLGVSTFQDYVINYVATALLNAIAFILAVAVIHIAIWFVTRLLDKLTRVPGLNLVNRLAGGALGLLQGLFILGLFFLVLSVLETASQGQALLQMVRESAVLNAFYETNLFLHIVLRAAAVFV